MAEKLTQNYTMLLGPLPYQPVYNVHHRRGVRELLYRFYKTNKNKQKGNCPELKRVRNRSNLIPVVFAICKCSKNAKLNTKKIF